MNFIWEAIKLIGNIIGTVLVFLMVWPLAIPAWICEKVFKKW